jgi:hypothetical protein
LRRRTVDLNLWTISWVLKYFEAMYALLQT